MTAPAQWAGPRIRRGLLWLGGGVAVLAMVLAVVVIETRGRSGDAPAAPVAAAVQPPTGDFDTYERANAARNEGRVERDTAAYDALSAAQDKPPAPPPAPDAPKR